MILNSTLISALLILLSTLGFNGQSTTFAEENLNPIITISTDKDSYLMGNEIKISGNVQNHWIGNPAIYQINAPNGVMLLSEHLEINENGDYGQIIQTGSEIWRMEGIYTVSVMHVADSYYDVTSFEYKIPEPTSVFSVYVDKIDLPEYGKFIHIFGNGSDPSSRIDARIVFGEYVIDELSFFATNTGDFSMAWKNIDDLPLGVYDLILEDHVGKTETKFTLFGQYEPIPEPEPIPEIQICHFNSEDNLDRKTLKILETDWPNHQIHDDILGKCPAISPVETEVTPEFKPVLRIWTDSKVYDRESIVQIKGKILNDSHENWSLEVWSPNSYNIVRQDLILDENGDFGLNLDTSDKIWFEDGIHFIKVLNESILRDQIPIKIT